MTKLVRNDKTRYEMTKMNLTWVRNDENGTE